MNSIDFSQPTELVFRELAKTDPQRLVAWIESGDLTPAQLTFAAEALGDALQEYAVPALRMLLSHESHLVREGAALGSANHMDENSIRDRMEEMSRSDLSPSVRMIASSIVLGADYT